VEAEKGSVVWKIPIDGESSEKPKSRGVYKPQETIFSNGRDKNIYPGEYLPEVTGNERTRS